MSEKLGTLGGNQSVANAINDRSQVAGAALNTIADPLSNAFSMFFLFVPPAPRRMRFAGPKLKVCRISERWAGLTARLRLSIDSVGSPDSLTPTQSSILRPGSQPWSPFFWEDGTMVDIWALDGTFGFSNWMNRGQVVGQSNRAGDNPSEYHAFRWDKQKGLEDLGTLGGSLSSANWINAPCSPANSVNSHGQICARG